MFYNEPVYRPLGDLYLTVEFGDELSILLNFRVIALDLAIKANGVRGVAETIPTNRSLGIVYDPYAVTFEDLVRTLEDLQREMTALTVLPSRLVTIPVWYNDPWSQQCAVDAGVPNNLEYIAQINSTTVEGVVHAHSASVWWVSAVGFQPATYQALPLSPEFRFTAPKYLRPRKSTPERIVCQAGKITSFYPVTSPGGYQLLGRTPLDLYDPQQRNVAFADGPVLPRVSDRHQYVAIDESTYWDIRRQVEAGTYEYQIRHETFDLQDYVAQLLKS